jgi:outer membrane protein
MDLRKFIIPLILVLIFGITNTLSGELIDKEELKGSILGLGALYSTQPYTDVDEDVWVVPLIKGRYKRFYVDGKSFGYILNDNEEFEFSVLAKPRLMGYEDSDSPVLAGMDDREWSIDAGLRFKWNNQFFTLSITALNDILNEHQGQEINCMVSREFKEGLFTPRMGVRYLSDDIVDYYYGVLGNEATPSRPVYTAEATLNYFGGFTVSIPIGEKWAVIGDFEYESLGSEIEDSPIVDTQEIITYIVGAVYRF